MLTAVAAGSPASARRSLRRTSRGPPEERAGGATRVTRWGNSLAVRIPRQAARKLGLTEGSEVCVTVKDQSLAIRRVRRISTLDELLDGVTPENAGGEIDSGPPVGREAW